MNPVLQWVCLSFALFMTGTTVRGCIEVTEPVAHFYVTTP